VIVSGNQALDPAGIASYCCYHEHEKGYARPKVLRPVAQTNYYFQRNKGLIAHNPLTDQRV